MSSLALSLLLLFAVVIAVVLVYNQRQSLPARWRAALRRLPASLGGEGKGWPGAGTRERTDAGTRNATRFSDRGEPRLSTMEGRRSDDGAIADAASAGPRDSAGAADEPAARSGRDTFDADPTGGPASEPVQARVAAEHAASHSASSASPPPRTSADAGGGRAASAAGAGAHAAGAGASAAGAVASSTAGTGPSGASSGAVPPPLSEICDCIVELALDAPWPGERLLPVAQRLRRAGSKPVAIEAAANPTGADGGWHAPQPGRAYDRLRVGILLANRHGPLNAMEYSEFASGVQTLAETLSASATVPAMGAILARARDLDATCAQLDAQIGVNVDADEAIEPSQLAAIAAQLRIVERGSHRYVRPGPQGEPIFSVALAEAPNRATFLLDVPRTSPALDPWMQMVECASAFAQRLGARLADDGGRALTAPALAQIGRQLEQRYESLEALGVPAGSPLALKVFN